MEKGKKIELLFSSRPRHWGLRGDPYLWDELEQYFKNEGIPESTLDFSRRLNELLKKLVGEELGTQKIVFIDRFPQRGMSGGMVSSKFWIEEGFPLLVERHRKIFDSSNYS